jgi:hypothetical protein
MTPNVNWCAPGHQGGPRPRHRAPDLRAATSTPRFTTAAGPANPDGWTGSSTMARSKRPKPPSPRRRTAERRGHVLRADRWRNARIGLEDTIPAASTVSCERYRQGPYQVPGLHRTLQELGYEPRRPEADCRRDDIEPIRRTAFVTDSGSTTRILAYPGREQVRSHARIMRRSH